MFFCQLLDERTATSRLSSHVIFVYDALIHHIILTGLRQQLRQNKFCFPFLVFVVNHVLNFGGTCWLVQILMSLEEV